MTTRRPVVLVSGVQSELPTGDTIDAALYQGQQIVAGSGSGASTPCPVATVS